MKLKKAIPYDIHIRASANNGFIVKMGCGEFVAETTSTLISDLTEFLLDPDKYVKDYNDKIGGEQPTTGRGTNELDHNRTVEEAPSR